MNVETAFKEMKTMHSEIKRENFNSNICRGNCSFGRKRWHIKWKEHTKEREGFGLKITNISKE